MNKFLTFNYWMNTRPGDLNANALNILIILIVVFVAIAFLAYLQKAKNKNHYYKLWEKISSFCIGNVIIGLFLVFFAFEATPFLSTRVLFLLWGAGMLIWIGFIIHFLVKIPKIKEKNRIEQEFNKYIP